MAFKVKTVKELEIEIEGVAYKVREPSLDELSSYSESMKGKEADQAALIKGARDFVNSLGFPGEFHSKMSWYGLRDLIEYIAGEKKKLTPIEYKCAKLAWFYGWTHAEILELPISVLNAYWLAITQIEAEQSLLEIQLNAFPEYKKEDRSKLIRSLKNSARFLDDNHPGEQMTLEQLAVKLAGGA